MAASLVTQHNHHQEPATQSRHFQCRFCGKTFGKNEHLVRHVRSHTKERPFRCSDCGNSYSRQDILIRHRRDVRCKRPVISAGEHFNQPMPEPFGTGKDMSPNGNTMLPTTASQRDGNGLPLGPTISHGSTESDGSDSITVGVHGTQYTANIHQFRPDSFEPMLLDSTVLDKPITLPSDFLDMNDYPLSWNIDSNLHDDILEMSFTPLEHVLTPELPSGPPADLEFVQTQHVQKLWFSYIREDSADMVYLKPSMENFSSEASGYTSPESRTTEIDDRYREKLQKRLQIFSYEPTVPSIDLLNIWIRLYFAKIHPVFPVIHAATFRPSRANTSLLIAMCAMGSLLTGSEQGLRQGIDLFERIHKATLLKWELLLARNQDTMISIIQCALISQIFGLLSGSPTLLLTVDAFHGPPIAWARHIRLHDARSECRITADIDGVLLEQLWQEWARNEELRRASHGLFIIDAELASVLHRETSQSFTSYKFSYTSSESVFMAPNAREWKLRYLAEVQTRRLSSSPESRMTPLRPQDLHRVPVESSFTAYIMLEGIGMQILEAHANPPLSLDTHQRSLIDFHQRFLFDKTKTCHHPLQLHILWHAVYMTVFTDFDLLEKATGREGVRLSNEEQEATTAWANSENSKKCIIHGLMIKKQVESAKVTSELAIHVLRAMFRTGIAIFCYLRFGYHDRMAHTGADQTSFHDRDLAITGEGDPLQVSDFDKPGVGDSLSLKMTLFAISDLLQHIGHWEIARKFASILSTIAKFQLDRDQVRT